MDSERMIVIELRTPAEIEEMRPAGRFVASVLEATSEAAAVQDVIIVNEKQSPPAY